MRSEWRTVVWSLAPLWLGLAAQPAEAQKLMAKNLEILSVEDAPDGSGMPVVPGAGKTVSKKGITIAFATVRDTQGRWAGYRYAETRIGDLKPDDRIWLFFRDLKLAPPRPDFWRSDDSYIWSRADAGGAPVLNPLRLKGIRGAWKKVTLVRVTREGQSLRIDFKEAAPLTDGRRISSLDFKIVEGYLVDATLQP